MAKDIQPKKSKFIAFILSFFWPGLGQIYLGRLPMGIILIIWMIMIGIVYFATGSNGTSPCACLLAPLYLVMWIYSMYDATQ